MRTCPCTISLSVLSVKRRTRSRPKSVIVTSNTPATVSTAIAPMAIPIPTRTRFMSERLPNREVKRQPVGHLPPSLLAALERIVGLRLLEGDDAPHAIVVDHLGDDREILGQSWLDAEIDADRPNRGGVPESEPGCDGARAAREGRDIAFADDSGVDENGHVERAPDAEAILDTALE